MLKILRLSALVLLTALVSRCYAQNAGEDVYKTSCAQCHGLTGEADTPAGKVYKARSLKSSEVLKMSDTEMLALAKKGKGQMPAWEDILTDDQIKDVITYIRTLQKSKSQGADSSAAAESGNVKP